MSYHVGIFKYKKIDYFGYKHLSVEPEGFKKVLNLKLILELNILRYTLRKYIGSQKSLSSFNYSSDSYTVDHIDW